MDDIEAEYFNELLPEETWADYYERHRLLIGSNDLIDINDMIRDYYFE